MLYEIVEQEISGEGWVCIVPLVGSGVTNLRGDACDTSCFHGFGSSSTECGRALDVLVSGVRVPTVNFGI